MTQRKIWIVASSLGIVLVVLVTAWLVLPRASLIAVPRAISVDGAIVTSVGDILFMGHVPTTACEDPAAIKSLLLNAPITLANLEVTLLSKEKGGQELQDSTGKPFGSTEDARWMAATGLNVVSLANNHSADFGVDGIEQTSEILDNAGLRHVGAGSDLEDASHPAIIGVAPRRVAILAVTISSAPESRATHSRGYILGRPGVSALRYSVDIEADPVAYTILKREKLARDGITVSGTSAFTLNGSSIRLGKSTTVNFRPESKDVDELIQAIHEAHSQAGVVVLSIHSHEPSNQSTAPPNFLRDIAHAAIDAGASLIVGTGPHQLRGVEVYKSGVILYSLGNFVLSPSISTSVRGDVFDSGIDLLQLALGAIALPDPLKAMPFDDDAYWESLVAVAQYHQDTLASVRLIPVDLGIDKPMDRRGAPCLAKGSTADTILERMVRLSERFGSRIRLENGHGIITLPENH